MHCCFLLHTSLFFFVLKANNPEPIHFSLIEKGIMNEMRRSEEVLWITGEAIGTAAGIKKSII